MQYTLKRLIISFFLLFSFRIVAALPTLPQPTTIIPAPPAIAAKSYVLIDALSDYVITEHDIDQRVEPASLTKMMTGYVVDHAISRGKIKLTDLVRISENAWRMPGSRMFVEVNTEVSVQDLLKGVIIQSGNDASVALAEHIAGSESAFAELMNDYAKQLGMHNTHFVNATGLPHPDHYTTARDIAILAKALIRDFQESYSTYSQKEFIYKNIKQPNRNRLLWRNDWIDGIKTGHTDSAGYCLAASGQQNNMRLIAVVMGAESDSARIDETHKLLTYGFRFFETRKLYAAGTALKKARVFMGAEKEVDVGLAHDLYITLGQGQYDRIQSSVHVENAVKAPAPQGAKLGALTVRLDNKTLLEHPLVALTEIHQGGFFTRLYDTVALRIHTWLDKPTSEK